MSFFHPQPTFASRIIALASTLSFHLSQPFVIILLPSSILRPGAVPLETYGTTYAREIRPCEIHHIIAIARLFSTTTAFSPCRRELRVERTGQIAGILELALYQTSTLWESWGLFLTPEFQTSCCISEQKLLVISHNCKYCACARHHQNSRKRIVLARTEQNSRGCHKAVSHLIAKH